VRVVATEKLYTQGNLTTGNPLDVAVQGRGFFQVLLPDGTLATRATARSS
jgi:flagellar basal-body rod protein FlgG